MVGDQLKHLVHMQWTFLIHCLSEECQELICHNGVNLELLTLPNYIELVE